MDIKNLRGEGILKQRKRRFVAGILTLSILLQLFSVQQVVASGNRDEVIRDAIMSNMELLRYETIMDTCERDGISNVTETEIREQITYLAETEGMTRISDQSFLMTMSMLDDDYDSILWPATHNSFANDPDGDPNYLSIEDADDMAQGIFDLGQKVSTENHTLSMKEQLNRGIRCIDIDLGPRQSVNGLIGGGIEGFFEELGDTILDVIDNIFGDGDKPSFDIGDVNDNIDLDWNKVDTYHRIAFMGTTRVSKVTDALKDFLDENPNDIVTLRISDMYKGVDTIRLGDNNSRAYELLNKFMKTLDDEGLLDQMANYYGEGQDVNSDNYHEYILNAGENAHGTSMDKWPSLGEMIMSNKRFIIITPTMYRMRGEGEAYKNTETVSFDKPSSGSDKPYKVSPARISLSDSKVQSLLDNPGRLIKVDAFGDDGKPAGDKGSSNQNNDGRRFYDLAVAYNDLLDDKGVDKVLNFFHVDYFLGNESKGGNQEVDIVDGANRINFEKQGYTWEDVQTIEEDLYWDYFDKESSFTINEYITSAWTDIDGFTGDDFIDQNVWSGTERQDIEGNILRVDFQDEVMVNKLYLNFFAYNDTVPVEVKLRQDGTLYNVGIKSIKQDRLNSWYAYDLNGLYKADQVEITFRTDELIHVKEVAFGGYRVNGNLESTTLTPEADTFVKWANKSGYNYHSDPYDINNMQVYDGEENKATFVKFDMTEFQSPTKEVKRAYLSFRVEDVNKKIKLKLREERDANDWKETELTGDKAADFDHHVFNKEKYVKTNGYVKFEVTDQLLDYLDSSDSDNKMTYKMSTDTNEWFVIKSRETNTPPQLEILYKEVELEFEEVRIESEAATFVKWGSNSKYNYSDSSYLEIYNSPSESKNSKTAFIKFDLSDFQDKKIKSAVLRLKLQVGEYAYLSIREDIDATDWAENELNGNKAKYFDHYNRVIDDKRYVETTVEELDVTNLIQNFVQRNDEDGKLTFRFSAPKKGKPWCYIHDRGSDNEPELIIEYAE